MLVENVMFCLTGFDHMRLTRSRAAQQEEQEMKKLVPSPKYLSQAMKPPSPSHAIGSKLLILDLNNVRSWTAGVLYSADVVVTYRRL